MPPISRTMLKSKIHRATVTDANLHYVGSVTVDKDLLDAADILPHELVHIVDINNGARFETYLIEGARGSHEICVNGAAARLAEVGDRIIIVATCWLSEAESKTNRPRIVLLNERNEIVDNFDAPTPDEAQPVGQAAS